MMTTDDPELDARATTGEHAHRPGANRPRTRPSVSQAFRSMSDDTNPRSLGTRMRRKRMAVFEELLASVRRARAAGEPVSVLDVGGTARFWAHMDMLDRGLDITTINLVDDQDHRPGVHVMVGDATRLPFADGAFDIVFSNSAIEHVGGPAAQRRMLAEMERVGRHGLFLQTPCRWFPIEPHFHFPFFGVLPESVRVGLVQRFDLGHGGRNPDRASAQARIDGVQLLKQRQLVSFAPAGTELRYERFAGWPKSYMLISSPDATTPGV
jgi:hypothetical protein